MYEVKIYKGVLCHDNEEWCKTWRGIDLSVQNWHEEFDEQVNSSSNFALFFIVILPYQFSLRCCINIQCHQTKPPYGFFSSNNVSFIQKKLIKVQIFEIFLGLLSKFVKFFMSILNWQVNSSSNFALFFTVMTQNSPVNFKLIHFLLWIKGSYQSPNF